MAPKAFLLYATTLLLFLSIFPHTILSRQSPETKPFDFLQQLEGCQKGQTREGVNQVKQYLRRFGYLTSATLDSNDDEFDELLESAVKTYQLNYNLKATGTLDSQTIKQMMMPRCGVPDIHHENGMTSAGKSNKKHHHHDQKLFHTVSHYNFFQNSPRWPPFSQLTYAFDSKSLPVVDIQTLRSVCSKAFSTWAAASGLSFVEVADQANIMIGFYRGEHGDGDINTFSGRVLAHAFPPRDGRFHYAADWNWSTNPSAQKYEFDLESLALHEIGHLLGLDHSLEPKAVMVSGIGAGVIKRELDGDDIAGIRNLYGLPN